MDKFNEAVSLRSKAVTRLADGAGFFRHMARQYPDAFDARAGRFAMGPVSYTHLTLPTICSV